MNGKGNGNQETFGGLAKRWLKSQLSINGDPMTSNRSHQESRQIENRMEEKAREDATAAAVGALIPPSWKRKMSEWETQEEERNIQLAERRRAEHEAMPRAMTRLSLTGGVTGGFEQRVPANVLYPKGEDTALVVELTPLEPVATGGSAFIGLQFAVPDYRGAGEYDLVALSADDRWVNDWDPFWFQMWIDTTDESFFWSPECGPASITVSDNERTRRVHIPMQDASSRHVVVDAAVELPIIGESTLG